MNNPPSIGEPVERLILGKVTSVILITLAGAAAAIGDGFDVQRSSVGGGGVMFSTGGDYELSATIGQLEAGILSGGTFSVSGGFWFPQMPADCNADGGVNLFDLADFQPCLLGPTGGYLAPPCRCFDLDSDGDVDLVDAGAFQCLFSG